MTHRRINDAIAPQTSVSIAHFEDKYAENPDPWQYRSSWYEKRKYAITVAALPRKTYHYGYEPGCSIGELTNLLATRCKNLLSVDCASDAITQAKKTNLHHNHVNFKKAILPLELPKSKFDLIVFSELLYYFSQNDLSTLIEWAINHLVRNGHMACVHWSAKEKCFGYDGFNVHGHLSEHDELSNIVHHEDENFLLDIFLKDEL